MAEWLLVRHGETQWNAERRVQGHIDIPLHEPGRRQIERAAARLASRPFDAVYASDLSRARETAEAIVAASESGPHDLRIDPVLREMAFGAFEGMNWREIQQAAGGAVIGTAQDLDYRPPDGESYRDLLDRSRLFADLLLREHADDDVLVVGHGAALRALTVQLLGMPYEAYWALGALASCSISIIRFRRGSAVIAAWNDTGHLE